MNDYIKVLQAIKSFPKSFQSNYVRNHAHLVAEAASRGHISCLSTSGINTGVWEVTTSGVFFLSSMGGCV